MRKFLPRFFIYFVSFFLGVLYALHAGSSLAASNHIVISQIQLRGVGVGTADNEFVELYNPTSSIVNLSGWRLKRETLNGATTSANLVASFSGTIQSHGYFLVASPEYAASISADIQYNTGNHIAADNTLLLYSDAGLTLIDKAGMGFATDFEAGTTPNPANGGSILRKVDETGGNGQDTDNNFNDFGNLGISNPRNSSVIITPTPTPTPTLEPSPTPTDIPSLTPTPTLEPTVTPSPTLGASPTPTLIPSPTLNPSPTPISLFPRLVCTTKFLDIHVLKMLFHIPYPVCTVTKK